MTDDASASCTYLMHTGPSGCVDVVPIVYELCQLFRYWYLADDPLRFAYTAKG